MPKKPADGDDDRLIQPRYNPEQGAALEGLARLITEVLNRELDAQRPDLHHRRIKSF